MSSGMCVACFTLLLLCVPGLAEDDAADWAFYMTNDNCPDYTWGLTEEQTRKAFADIVCAHLDEMKRTDGERSDDQDRYNMAVTQEVICFVERYPDRKDELIRRIREGRVYVSPYLCNSLWAFQSVEGAIRTFYPARRLERDWGISFDVAEHIEQPSLPWGVATILAGCGIRWLSNPFYGYDSTFAGLRNPPLFILEGPDGSHVRVVMDRFACGAASYTQGARLLREPDTVAGEWLRYYRGLGDTYRTRSILASGTHGDISPSSGDQARGFADAIARYNRRPGPHPRLVNAILPQFCRAIDETEARSPFLTTLRGCFGHSWDVWPVCMARYVADMREGERDFLAAEALVTAAMLRDPGLGEATRVDRERAEWCLAMLSDHAWNGTHRENKNHNADLRRKWSQELKTLAAKIRIQAWKAMGIGPSADGLTLFNPLSFPRRGLVRMDSPVEVKRAGTQDVDEDGRNVRYFVSATVPGFGAFASAGEQGAPADGGQLRASAEELDGPYYRLRVDAKRGGIASLVHKSTGRELIHAGNRSIGQTIYHDGQEHVMMDVSSRVVAAGPVLARIGIEGAVAGIQVTQFVTIYRDLDHVDLDVRIRKPLDSKPQRLCHVFPVVPEGGILRIETTGAVIRPRPQPDGDLLPGADTRRFAVQGFVDASCPEGPGVTIAPLDAFVLRTDLDSLTFEALGNDQNHAEVIQDQHGLTDFRFRYALRAHANAYSGPEVIRWSRAVSIPLLAAPGLPRSPDSGTPEVCIDPARAVATCLKPADFSHPDGIVVRIWETAGRGDPLALGVQGFTQARRTDLLERDIRDLPIQDGQVRLDVRGYGLTSVRLSR